MTGRRLRHARRRSPGRSRNGFDKGREGQDRVNSGERRRWRLVRFVTVATMLLSGILSCAKQPPPETPLVRTTKAFDEIFGELPRLPLPGPAYATVAYFPSSLEPEKFRPVPIFSVEQGKEEELVVRTVIRGIGTEGGPAGALLAEIVHPFPDGSDLSLLTDDGGKARIAVGGSFRSESLSGVQKEKAAKALALTVSQFGKARRVEVTDGTGKTTFGAEAGSAEIVDIGTPKVLGLLAVREGQEKPPEVLSVLFDRPVFVEDAAFSDAGGGAPYPGKVYSTGFGMSVEFHPGGETGFDPSREYRVRLTIRDGKGRKTSVEEKWRPKEVTRH